ncbi:GNAT family N-acetyltransferase [Dorea sp. D27]|uniref:GNAT family N-acetyltransferase n=1 Tax=Dorea sp. D27 TaxID=658665 RepID=UPI001FA7F10E|nr:GNAT family N-acetyltransferase [Dorea sp. D27]
MTGIRMDEVCRMIRKMKKKDLDKVMEIWLDTNIKAHNFIPKSYWESNAQSVREMISEAEVYVYESGADGEVQAFAGVSGSHIAGLFVDGAAQSGGIGKALLDYLKDKRPALELCVYEKNERAVHFYKREKFQAASEGIDKDTEEKEIIMTWDARRSA